MYYDGSLSDLDVVERRFVDLTAPPNPLALDGAALGCGLPPQLTPLDELRLLLTKRQTDRITKDVVWRELVRRAHDEPEPWIIAAAGMMVPGMRRIVSKLGARYPGDKSDLDAEVVEGFLEALDLAEHDQPKVYCQLYFGAFQRGHQACNREWRLRGRQTGMEDRTVGAYRRKVVGHPDLLLANAVLDNALTAEQAELLARVHLDGAGQECSASCPGTPTCQCQERLACARRKLIGYLGNRIPDAAA